MLWIIGIIVGLVIIFAGIKAFLQMKGTGAMAQFELPAGSDKAFYEDPKTGKKYDKEAYDRYLKETARRLSDQQIQTIINQRRGRSDLWNTLLCDALRAELNARANADADEEEDEEEEVEAYSGEEDEEGVSINEEIAPFFWVDQETGASVGLTPGAYLKDVFATRAQEGFTGNGYDWNSLARAYLADEPALHAKLQFDSQEDLFSVYCRDSDTLETFIYGFKAACEDHERIMKLFAQAKK